MTLGAFQQDIERICSLKQAVVQCTIQSERQLPYNTTNPEGEEEAHYYSLITLTVQKRQFTVLCADFSSPLLTCDTFLVEKSKVCNLCVIFVCSSIQESYFFCYSTTLLSTPLGWS